MTSSMNFAVIVGNRGFFPDSLAKQGRTDILNVLGSLGHQVIAVDETQTKHGVVETYAEACQCADLFSRHRDQIDGVIVSLPNFGDEKGVLHTIRRSGLNVPILIQAEPDNPKSMAMGQRRDSFCGKISVCNNLTQAGIPFTLTGQHTVSVNSTEFQKDIEQFASVCRIVNGICGCRFGAIGVRPNAFNTVRYSEKILEQNGIVVEVIDLSEILAGVEKLDDADMAVQNQIQTMSTYVNTESISKDILNRLAKFGVVVDLWVNELELDGTAIQCWTSLQENLGICSCLHMSMMGQLQGKPSACEVDIAGLLSMYVLQLAGQSPSALMDWNNNYGDDPDKCICFHCSNLPSSFFDQVKIEYQEIIADSVGKNNTYGTVTGHIKPSPMTYCRLSTDEKHGTLNGYIGEGRFTDDPINSFGGYGVVEIPHLARLLETICRNGFEHHVAVNLTQTSQAIKEALTTYLGWKLYT